jgi:hypothetical protein
MEKTTRNCIRKCSCQGCGQTQGISISVSEVNLEQFIFLCLDHIRSAMLALFETLSYKGWNVIRDILWIRQGPWAALFIHVYVSFG